MKTAGDKPDYVFYCAVADNAPVFSQFFNQLYQDGVVEPLRITYNETETPGEYASKWTAVCQVKLTEKSLFAMECEQLKISMQQFFPTTTCRVTTPLAHGLRSLEAQYMFSGEMADTKERAKNLAVAKAASVIPLISRSFYSRILFKKKQVVITFDGRLEMCG